MSIDTFSSQVYPPSAQFAAQAQIPTAAAFAALCDHAACDTEGFYAALARQHLCWDVPFARAQTPGPASAMHPTPGGFAQVQWFAGGRLNVSANCLDRHLAGSSDKVAIAAESESGEVRRVTYRQLHAAVCRLANVFKLLGLRQGDRVVLVLPNIPEAVMGMQACARLGLVHAVVFAGFSAQALRDRIEDTGAKLVLTADASRRGGRLVALKAVVDAALAAPGACPTVEHVLVLNRGLGAPEAALGAGPDAAEAAAPMASHRRPADRHPARTLDWQTAADAASPSCEPVSLPADQPLFILYTSGSTGKPKGIVHGSAGYALGAMTSLQWVFDLRATDVFWCTADVGWITGHTYVAYGPLLMGVTQVMYEGGPLVPHAGRYWELCARHAVSIFYTAPTAIRTLMQHGEAPVLQHNLSRLRLLGCVGEPINKEAWLWFYQVVGQGRCPLVDTWWQTETGSIVAAPVPGVHGLRPGSCAQPLPGMAVALVDDEGNKITEPNVRGHLVLTAPWPSMLQTVYGNPARAAQAYWGRFAGRYYVSGDAALRDAEGNLWILGRTDDVLNVSGHRLSTMEIEAALCAHPQVAEAAVVSVADAIKGEAVYAFVVIKAATRTGVDAGQDAALGASLKAWVASQIGGLARPQTVQLCRGLPKTRSGKILRRLLRSLARNEPLNQDMSTLDADSLSLQILEDLRHRGPATPAA
jgi:acetyl-CoA synthetase